MPSLAAARALLGVLLALSLPGAARSEPATVSSADREARIALLREADHSRGNVTGVTWEVDVEAREGEETTARSFKVSSRGYDFVGESLTPARHKGQKLLMIEGSMWFHKPGLSKPIAVSRRQRLLGQAAYGDIAATNYADEYEPEIAGEDTVDGERCLVFELKARTKNATYDRIRYWISGERRVGVRAEYFTVSGKVIKRATIEYAHRTQGEGEGEGEPRPFISRIVIRDALLDDHVTVLTFRDPEFAGVPDHLFNLRLLGR